MNLVVCCAEAVVEHSGVGFSAAWDSGTDVWVEKEWWGPWGSFAAAAGNNGSGVGVVRGIDVEN